MIKVYLPLYRSEIKEMLNEIEEITLEKEEGIYLIYSSKNDEVNVARIKLKLKNFKYASTVINHVEII